jgi:hypothetical protein
MYTCMINVATDSNLKDTMISTSIVFQYLAGSDR